MGSQSQRREIWIASTFFFQKLTSCGATCGEDGWRNVCRWTKFREGGVLSKKYLFVPINVENKHWWLAVICNAGQAFVSKGAAGATGTPRIVFLDSSLEPELKSTAAGFIRGYIWREWCEREECGMSSARASSQ